MTPEAVSPAPSLRVGHGHAYGAVTVLNATCTGIGCSLAIDLQTHATWRWVTEPDLRLGTMGADDRLGRAVWELLRGRLPATPPGAQATVHCPFPPSRGLKTSSSVAAALVRAGHDALKADADHATVEALSVEASRKAGVTITGAYDDQAAAVRGGCHVTENKGSRIVASLRAHPWHVALWVGDSPIPKSRIEGIDTSPIRKDCEEAERLARSGRIPEAMTANGRAFHRLYRGFGLPVDDEPTQVALRSGALGAGLSGTGPSIAALFDKPVDLPAVRGGTWAWARAVP